MKDILFTSPTASHEHSLRTLNTFYEFDDFMESVGTVLDLGCGSGLDLSWWANATTRDETPRPLNIKCTGIDQQAGQPAIFKNLKNVTYRQRDLEEPLLDLPHKKYDLLWCHDVFQYILDPFTALRQWRDVTDDGGMLVLIVPQMTNLEFNTQAFDQPDGVYWNWTMVSLIHVLALSGWDCEGGFFTKSPNDPWLHAVVYKSKHEPMDPRTTRWYHLADAGLLPRSAAESVRRHGYLRQRDLLLPWLDKSLMSMEKH